MICCLNLYWQKTTCNHGFANYLHTLSAERVQSVRNFCKSMIAFTILLFFLQSSIAKSLPGFKSLEVMKIEKKNLILIFYYWILSLRWHKVMETNHVCLSLQQNCGHILVKLLRMLWIRRNWFAVWHPCNLQTSLHQRKLLHWGN